MLDAYMKKFNLEDVDWRDDPGLLKE